MKVSGTRGPNSVGGAAASRARAAAPGFAPIGSSGVAEGGSVTASGGVAHVSSLEALIALQEVGGPLDRRRRAVSRAGRLLDALDDLKLDLLEGRIGGASVETLVRAVREQRHLTDDPRLEGLLDEIETRAVVELAKREAVKVAP